MQYITDSDSRSPPPSGGIVTRAQSDAQNTTARPPLTSGFGAVIEKEHDLQTAIEGSVGQVSGAHAVEIDRILRHHHAQLSANIALLAQRYEALPSPERFVSWTSRRHSLEAPRPPGHYDEIELLPELISRHNSLLASIEALIGCGHDGQRGELILSEISRNHEEMAWMLTALLKEDATAMRTPGEGGESASPTLDPAESRWVTEGGADHQTQSGAPSV